MGENWIVQVLREPVTPGYIAVLFLIGICLRYGPAFMAAFNERFRDRAKITAEEWERLLAEIKRLAAECTDLRAKYNECEEERRTWMGRAVAAEAEQLGRGKAMNEAQKIVSTERERAKYRKGEGE